MPNCTHCQHLRPLFLDFLAFERPFFLEGSLCGKIKSAEKTVLEETRWRQFGGFTVYQP